MWAESRQQIYLGGLKRIGFLYITPRLKKPERYSLLCVYNGPYSRKRNNFNPPLFQE